MNSVPHISLVCCGLVGTTVGDGPGPESMVERAFAEAIATQGVVLAVTHDRWFARSFDRFLVFGSDGDVYEAADPVWDETRTVRPR